MIEVYNFLASWQLFPERCEISNGELPRSGTLVLEETNNKKVKVKQKNISPAGEITEEQFLFVPNAMEPVEGETVQNIRSEIIGTTKLVLYFLNGEHITHLIDMQILPNGNLEVVEESGNNNGKAYRNKLLYHKQWSVLPYASSVSGAVIRPTSEGVRRSKALQNMEDQTERQLDQIREQINLLARQAQAIQQRKTLSLLVYEAKMSFTPVIGQTYHLYEREDNSYILSMISPQEWGSGSGPFRQFIASVKLLGDHTWEETQG